MTPRRQKGGRFECSRVFLHKVVSTVLTLACHVAECCRFVVALATLVADANHIDCEHETLGRLVDSFFLLDVVAHPTTATENGGL
jgi:hypothetical protein